MSFKAYEEFKDSNIDWIGPIPNYWQSYKLKHVINEFIAGGTPKSSNNAFWDENNDGIPWIAIGDMTDNDYVNSTAKSITREGLADKNLRILKKGTLIYSIFASLGKTSILNIDATTNQAILGLITSNKIDVKYLKYYLEALKGTISRYSNENTQENLNSNIVKNMQIAMPQSLEEQHQIANYLDKQTAKIDATIAKNEELIQLLEEKRVALINQVVTKGLNPDVPMKDSGVEWIKTIPENWDVHQIKNLIFFQEGPGLRNWQFTDGGIRVICVTNITEKGIDFTKYEKFISEEEYHQMYQHFTVNTGDLLLSSSGNSWGKVAEYTDDETVILNTSTIRINKNPSSDYELKQPYIKWVLQSEYIREQLGLMMTGSCQPNFGPTHLAKVLIALPTPKEQDEIAEFLENKIIKINNAIYKIQENIDLLIEYKTSMIHHVVTGKIDVRGEKI